jgi:hypothetical protein
LGSTPIASLSNERHNDQIRVSFLSLFWRWGSQASFSCAEGRQ